MLLSTLVQHTVHCSQKAVISYIFFGIFIFMHDIKFETIYLIVINFINNSV
jgi:hypothetical protein